MNRFTRCVSVCVGGACLCSAAKRNRSSFISGEAWREYFPCLTLKLLRSVDAVPTNPKRRLRLDAFQGDPSWKTCVPRAFRSTVLCCTAVCLFGAFKYCTFDAQLVWELTKVYFFLSFVPCYRIFDTPRFSISPLRGMQIRYFSTFPVVLHTYMYMQRGLFVKNVRFSCSFDSFHGQIWIVSSLSLCLDAGRGSAGRTLFTRFSLRPFHGEMTNKEAETDGWIIGEKCLKYLPRFV